MNKQSIRLGLSTPEVLRQLQKERVVPFHMLCSSCPHLSTEEVEASVRALQEIGRVVDKVFIIGEFSARLVRLTSS